MTDQKENKKKVIILDHGIENFSANDRTKIRRSLADIEAMKPKEPKKEK